jgi:hypothetical protein
VISASPRETLSAQKGRKDSVVTSSTETPDRAAPAPPDQFDAFGFRRWGEGEGQGEGQEEALHVALAG